MSKRRWAVVLLTLALVFIVVVAACTALPQEQPVKLAITWDLPAFVNTNTPTATWVPGIWLFDQSIAAGNNCPSLIQTAVATAAPTGGALITPGPYGGHGNYTLCNTYSTPVTLKVMVSAIGRGWSASSSALANCGTTGTCETPWGPQLGGSSTTSGGYCGQICGAECFDVGWTSTAGGSGAFVLAPYQRVYSLIFNVYHLHLFAAGTNCLGGNGAPGYAAIAYEVSTFTPSPTPTYTPTPSITPTPSVTPTPSQTPTASNTPATCAYPPCITPSPTPITCQYPPCDTPTPGYATPTLVVLTSPGTLTPLPTVS